MRMMRLLGCGALLLAGGCAVSLSGYSGYRGDVPIGTVLALRQPVTYATRQTSMWFQHGVQRPSSGVTVWEHHCSLDLREFPASPYTIEGGEFIVTGVREERFAQAPTPLRRVKLFEHDRGTVTVSTYFYLTAPEHPWVKRLRCEVMEDVGALEQPLTLAGLAAVLGPYFDLRLP